MIPTLKSEFKKLFTVRSTYFVTLLMIVLASLFTYLGTSRVYEDMQPPTEEQMSAPQEAPSEAQQQELKDQQFIEPKLTNKLPKNTILNHMQSAAGLIGLLAAVVAILLMAHEFRYNTITHTLTASNNRSKVLISKIIVTITYTVVLTLLALGTVVIVTYAAVAIKDLILPAQDYDWIYVLSRLLAYTVGYSLLGLALITLVRNLTAGMVLLFFLPLIEQIAGGIMQSQNLDWAKYLPVTALTEVASVGFVGETLPDDFITTSVTSSLVSFGIFLVVLWIASWYLFIRRDAN